MNKFAAYTDAGAMTMAFYDTMTLPVPQIALDFTVCDRFFHSAFGGSFINHMWLVSATTPVFPDAPSGLLQPGDVFPRTASPFPLTAQGTFTGEDSMLTPDGYAVNTAASVNLPHPLDADPASLLPQQTDVTIGDRLSEAGLSWAWYAGGWDATLAFTTAGGVVPDGAPTPADFNFQYHHQPFVYFANFADGTAAKAEHLKDETEFVAAARTGTLPAVSFVKPSGIDNEHPGYTDVMRGETHLAALIRAVMEGPNWSDTAIIVTYDEHGGYADHVPPPIIDRWGPGSRVPTVVISPHARKGFVDHTPYETVSILATLERRWGLLPLTARDANANDLAAAFLSGD
jgi:acid phosphatase